MTAPEFSRPIDRRRISPQPFELEATPSERTALAARFGLVAIEQLAARVQLAADGDAVAVEGRLTAQIVQSCAVSGEDLPVSIDEPLALRFVPDVAETADEPDEEIELDASELDEIAFTGHSFDLGEAVAQSLALAIDPYATGPEAERARREAGIGGEEASGPFAALAALKKD